MPKVVAAIPRAFVSLADPAACSASFQTSSANVSMVRPAPNSASFQTSSANVSMVRPAPNVTSVKPSSSNVSMVRPAQSCLALSPAVNSGQRSKSAKTRTDRDCVDIPVAVTIPSNGPSPILSLTSEALSKTHSHLSDGESFNRLSYIDSTPYSTEGSLRTEGPDSNKSAPNSGGEEEPPRNNWGNKSDDGQPDLENETDAEMDVSLEKYSRQGRADRIPKKTRMTSYRELDEPRDNNRSQQSSQPEREADPQSQDGFIPSRDEISLSTTPVIQINITIPMMRGEFVLSLVS